MDPQLIAGRYEVQRAIGRGGMGTVWLARDNRLGRDVAVKQIGALPGESANETRRAMREARSAAALNHPNAVAVYDVVDHEGAPWLVMEYVEGETLADVVAREGALDPRRVADIGSQLASALARAHERGIVHRDIKPGNVLIDRSGTPKISDFGIARGLGDEALTQTGFVTGTPGYLSPELARGEDPDAASDVWALGATLYAAVEAHPPFAPRSNPIALLQDIARGEPEPMEHAGPVGGAIAAMMHKDPSQRWDMSTAAARLGRVAGGDNTLMLPAAAAGAAAAGATEVLPRADEPTQAMAAPLPAAAPAPVQEQRYAAPAAAAAQQGTSRPGPAGRDRDLSEHRSGSRRWLPVLLALLLVLGLGGFYLASRANDDPGSATPTDTTSTTTEPQQTSEPEPSPTSETSTTSEPPTTTDAPTTPSEDDGEQASGREIEKFVRDYFKDVTGDRDKTWSQLTPEYQSRMGGRPAYDGFWSTIDSVQVRDLETDAEDGRVTARLTYKRKDGSEATERHELTVVEQGGGLLIADDSPTGGG
jgi:serine/threonine protein kinase